MTTKRPPVRVSTAEVARLAGCSARQLDYWARKGWVRVAAHPGTGSPRSWTPDDIRHAAIMATLVATLGADPAMASRVADVATSNTGRFWSASLEHLLIVGDLVWVPEPPQELEP